MPITINLRQERGMPTVHVTGNLDFGQAADMRAIGASYRNKRYMPEHWSDYNRSRSTWDVPAPLLKRLFVGNGEVRRPEFMEDWEDWEDHIEPYFEDNIKVTPDRFKRLVISSEAVEFYEIWQRFEKQLAKIKAGEEETIQRILAPKLADDFFSRPPLPHQRAGLAFFFANLALGNGHICLFDEMRTGKTFQAIHIARYLIEQKLIKGVLVIVPNSIKYVWINELRLDAPLHALFSCVIEGTKSKKDKLWNSANLFYVTNYECARADKNFMYAWADRKGDYMLICDEAHKIKNPDSQQTRAILKLQPKYSVFLTGTPVANRPEDAFTMADFVCPGILGATMKQFEERFCVRGGYTGTKIIDYKDLKEVKYRLARISMRRRRKDVVFDRVVRQERIGEMKGDQKSTYEKMRKDLWATITNQSGEWTSVQAQNHMVKVMRLQEITSGFLPKMEEYIDDEGRIRNRNTGETVWFDDNWKLAELDEFIAEYLDDIGKLVVWTRWVPVIELLTERYKKYGATKIRGQMGQTATDNMYKFQQDPNCRIMVAQIQTSEGRGFQPATFCIFFDKWWSPALNKQAEDRIVGIKNPVPITSISFITKGTIDRRMENVLNEKKQWADIMLGDEGGEIKVPRMGKKTLLYLLANEEELQKYTSADTEQ